MIDRRLAGPFTHIPDRTIHIFVLYCSFNRGGVPCFTFDINTAQRNVLFLSPSTLATNPPRILFPYSPHTHTHILAMADLKAHKRQKFEHAFEVIRDELLAHFASNGMPKDAQEWYRKVCSSSSSNRLGICVMHMIQSTNEIYSELGLQRPWGKTEPRDVCC